MTLPDTSNGTRSRILIVDDMPANLRLLVNMLAEHGYSVHPATNGRIALEFALSVLPDLVLLDILMPDMDGYEVCRRLKENERTRDIPVIFISSADHVLDKTKAFSCGCIDYIVRPLQAEEVLARIKTHLSLHNLQKHLEEMVRERTSALIEANARLQNENVERKQAEERIRVMAHHDALTGLPNRMLLQDRVERSIAWAHRRMGRVAVLFIDLDYFKNINDSLGHPIGDRLLQMAASRLQQCLREDDSVARWGGDEFVLCLPLDNGKGDAALVANKVLDALGTPFIVEGHSLHVSASIGISIYPEDGMDETSLMRAADTAMYHAKESGRGNYQFFTPDLSEAAQFRFQLTDRLRRALENDEFVLHYQPQVDMATGTIFSAEALLRWNQPGKAPVSCGAFIAIAEETGLILPIGEWALRQACRQLKRWHDAGHNELRIAVNLSPRQLYQENFQDTVKRILEENQLAPHYLDIEITEGLLIQKNETNASTLAELSKMGIQLSVDDFGTGYSNLAYLGRFPVDTIKVDQSFIRRIGQTENDTALVVAIIAIAEALHLKILAEGVETEDQVNFLKAHHCMAAQGFYYSEAISAAQFTEFLEVYGGHVPPHAVEGTNRF